MECYFKKNYIKLIINTYNTPKMDTSDKNIKLIILNVLILVPNC